MTCHLLYAVVNNCNLIEYICLHTSFLKKKSIIFLPFGWCNQHQCHHIKYKHIAFSLTRFGRKYSICVHWWCGNYWLKPKVYTVHIVWMALWAIAYLAHSIFSCAVWRWGWSVIVLWKILFHITFKLTFVLLPKLSMDDLKRNIAWNEERRKKVKNKRNRKNSNSNFNTKFKLNKNEVFFYLWIKERMTEQYRSFSKANTTKWQKK